MKLLLDQNLSHKLVARLGDLFAGSMHIRGMGMAAADDRVIWEYAPTAGFTIASKDGDFHQLGLLRGAPPKIVWPPNGQCLDRRDRQPDASPQ